MRSSNVRFRQRNYKWDWLKWVFFNSTVAESSNPRSAPHDRFVSDKCGVFNIHKINMQFISTLSIILLTVDHNAEAHLGAIQEKILPWCTRPHLILDTCSLVWFSANARQLLCDTTRHHSHHVRFNLEQRLQTGPEWMQVGFFLIILSNLDTKVHGNMWQ